MIKVLMNGCNGKMGQVITKLVKEYDDICITAGVTRDPSKRQNSYPVFRNFKEVAAVEADVVLDFSNPEALPDVVEYCVKHQIALVVGTTGLSENNQEMLRQASASIPVFVSANMSFGVTVLMDLALKAASALGPEYDIEILEKHHNEKKDAPSGTAIMIGKELKNQINNSFELIYDRSKIKEKRKSNEIGISSIRGGTIAGDHTIFFAGKDEIIEIRHTSLSRDILGRGTIRAARYTVLKPNGLYNMKNMLEDSI
ncbi:MAG TPA: 4-hydroxy-tetrahydrodipicolinate reductase [Bacillota bacterium]|nr:4-hydroxy-tetrahydrodipicolinate reductase [Bacillota bacterium]HPL53383.1 4-hydroxy-tetrahydrodipicolinate reductase [Bacillota bacterium]